jgi:hypothetical protein
MVRGEGNGTTEGEMCGVRVVREYELEAEVAWWSAYMQVEGGVGRT